MQHVGVHQRRARVAEMLDLVGLAGYGNRRVDTLSGGEAQRVALARSLAPAPQLLMLDEPFGSLDRGLRERLTAEVRGLLRAVGVTAIHVTHDQDEAATIADRVALMRAGRFVQIDAPAALWHHPQSEFVARFFGRPNIVDLPGRGRAIIPVDAITIGALNANDTATVLDHAFHDGRYRTRMTTSVGELTIDSDCAYEPGTIVAITIDTTRAIVLPTD